MEKNEFQKLKEDVRNYKNKKDETKQQINKIHQDVINQKRHPWHTEELVNQLHKDLYDTSERKKFSELSKKAIEIADFEKYFRSAHLEIFFGIAINPENL